MLVTTLIRRTQAMGGFATVLRKGDSISGAILIQTLDKGQESGLFERVFAGDAGYQIMPAASKYWGQAQELTQYIARRVLADTDLWLIELDIPDAERFIVEALQ
jgi:hypothetical protein